MTSRRAGSIALVLGLGAWLAPGLAAANTSTQVALETVLTLLAVLGGAYLVTHLALERIARRFAVVTGVEYVLVGVALGPVLSVLDRQTASLLQPALTLGTGALGLLTGLWLDARGFRRADARAFGAALVISLVTAGLVVGLPALVLSQAPPHLLGLDDWLPGLLFAGAVALVADAGPIHSLVAFLQAKGVAPVIASRAADFSSTLAVIGFGALFCVYQGGPLVEHRVLAPWQWFLVQLGVGVLLGLLFRGFLRKDIAEEKLLTILIGMVIFTSGIAYYLGVSVIFTNFVLGAVLINTSAAAAQVLRMMASIRRPFHIVLFFFAGVFLSLDVPWWSWALAVPYLLLRVGGRYLGGALAQRFVLPRSPPMPGPGLALLAPGGLSVAMMINFRLTYHEHRPIPEVYSALLVGVVVSEILAYLSTRRWLIDAADVPPALAERRGGFDLPGSVR